MLDNWQTLLELSINLGVLRLINFMHGSYYHFNNLRFKQSQQTKDVSAAHAVMLFVLSEIIKCILLKLLLDHPTIIGRSPAHQFCTDARNFTGSSPYFLRNFARVSNWSTLNKGTTTAQPSHNGHAHPFCTDAARPWSRAARPVGAKSNSGMPCNACTGCKHTSIN